MLNIKKLFLKILEKLTTYDSKFADYDDLLYTETTNGNWTIREWNDGRVELFLSENVSTTITNSGGIYTSNNISRNISSVISLSKVLGATVTVAYGSYPVFATVMSITTNNIIFRIASGVSRTSSATYGVYTHIIGKK